MSASELNAARRFVSPDEALRLVLEAAVVCPPVRMPLVNAHGSVLAESIAADRDYPNFDRAQMDGYAVAENAAGRRLAVVGLAAAGRPVARGPSSDFCVEIMTGAACPAGTHAVVPREHVPVEDEVAVMPARIDPGQYIACRGSECHAGEVVLRVGQRLDAIGIAVLSSFGIEEVLVVRPPRVAIVTTGAELALAGQPLREGQIRDANGPMLAALTLGLGLLRPTVLRANDDLESIVAALAQTAECEVVLLSGGVSEGKFDLVPAALEGAGAAVLFRKVLQKPGKPLLVARHGVRLLFGLPGNPLGCHLCFHRYVAPALRSMRGEAVSTAGRWAQLSTPVGRDLERTRFVLAAIEPAASPGELPRAHPSSTVSSADVFHGCGATGYLEIPPGADAVQPGDVVSFTSIEPQ